MTLEELYQEIGGNYINMKERLRREDRIEKFVLLFLKDNSYQVFVQAMEKGNDEEAFRAAHTLKGICMNLSFDALYQISSQITEYLRAHDMERAAAELPRFEGCYEKHIRAIHAYSIQAQEGKCRQL